MMLIIIDDDRNVQPTKNDDSDAGGSVYYTRPLVVLRTESEAKLISTYSLQTIIDHAGLLLRLRGAGVHRSTTTVLAVVRSTRI